jgi:hypothetical protein
MSPERRPGGDGTARRGAPASRILIGFAALPGDARRSSCRAKTYSSRIEDHPMFDDSARKSKMQLAANDGAGSAQQELDLTDLGSESMQSHTSPERVNSTQGPTSIAKPSTFDLDKFKSKRAPAAASVETLQTALPHHSIAHAKDFVRLHPDEENCWSPELCFVNVPIKGQKRDMLHLIEEGLGMRYPAECAHPTLPPGAWEQTG